MKRPESYFKFVTKDRKDILAGGMIRFTPPSELNDPFEMSPHLTHLSRPWLSYLNENNQVPPDFTIEDYKYSQERHEKLEEYKKILSSRSEKIGILSLSASYDVNKNPSIFLGHLDDPRHNLLMWSHYCESHTGFVIEFDPAFLGCDKNEVCYARERPSLTFDEVDSNEESHYLHKSSEWIYENEWRCFKSLDRADHVVTASQGCNAPSKDIHLFCFDKKYVKSITFGCRAEEKTKEEIIEIIKSDPCYIDTSIFFSRTRNDLFGLYFYQEHHDGDHIWSNSPEFGAIMFDAEKIPGSY